MQDLVIIVKINMMMQTTDCFKEMDEGISLVSFLLIKRSFTYELVEMRQN